jgi:hypothetical protein
MLCRAKTGYADSTSRVCAVHGAFWSEAMTPPLLAVFY